MQKVAFLLLNVHCPYSSVSTTELHGDE